MAFSDAEDGVKSRNGDVEEKEITDNPTENHAKRNLAHDQLRRSNMLVDICDDADFDINFVKRKTKDDDDAKRQSVFTVPTTKKVILRKAKSTQNLREREKEKSKEDESSKFITFLNFFKRKRNSDFVQSVNVDVDCISNSSDASSSDAERKSSSNKPKERGKNYESDNESATRHENKSHISNVHRKKKDKVVRNRHDSVESVENHTTADEGKEEENIKPSMMERFRSWKAERRRHATEEKEVERMNKKVDEIQQDVQIHVDSRKMKKQSDKTNSVQEENEDIEEKESSLKKRPNHKVKTGNKKRDKKDEAEKEKEDETDLKNDLTQTQKKETNQKISNVEENIKVRPLNRFSIFEVAQAEPTATPRQRRNRAPTDRTKSLNATSSRKPIKQHRSIDKDESSEEGDLEIEAQKKKRSGRPRSHTSSFDADEINKNESRSIKLQLNTRRQMDQINDDSNSSIESLLLPGEFTNRDFDGEIQQRLKKCDDKQARKALNQYLHKRAEKSSQAHKLTSDTNAAVDAEKITKKRKISKATEKYDSEESKKDFTRKSAFQTLQSKQQEVKSKYDTAINEKPNSNLTNSNKETKFLNKLRDRLRQSVVNSTDVVISYQEDSEDSSDVEKLEKNEKLSKQRTKKISRAMKISLLESVSHDNSNKDDSKSEEDAEAVEEDVSVETARTKSYKESKSTFQKNNFFETGGSHSRRRATNISNKTKKEYFSQDFAFEYVKNGTLYPAKPWSAALYTPELISSKDDYIGIFHLNNLLANQSDRNRVHVIDTRPYEIYLNSHINLANHVSEYQDEEGGILEEIFAESDTVVLYDDDGQSFSLTESSLSRFYESIIHLNINVHILHGGFHSVVRKASYILSKKRRDSKRDSNNDNGVQQRLSFPTILKDGLITLLVVDKISKLVSFCDLFKITHVITFDSKIVKSCPNQVKSLYLSADDIKSEKIDDAIIFFLKARAEYNDCRLLMTCTELDWRYFVLLLTFVMFISHWTLESAICYSCKHLSINELRQPALKILQRVEQKLFGKVTSTAKSLAALSVTNSG